jgi:hypothetical protein
MGRSRCVVRNWLFVLWITHFSKLFVLALIFIPDSLFVGCVEFLPHSTNAILYLINVNRLVAVSFFLHRTVNTDHILSFVAVYYLTSPYFLYTAASSCILFTLNWNNRENHRSSYKRADVFEMDLEHTTLSHSRHLRHWARLTPPSSGGKGNAPNDLYTSQCWGCLSVCLPWLLLSRAVWDLVLRTLPCEGGEESELASLSLSSSKSLASLLVPPFVHMMG